MKKIIFLCLPMCIIMSSCLSLSWSRFEYFWRGDFLSVNLNESLERVKATPMEKEFASIFYPFDSHLTLLLRRLLCLQEKGFISQTKAIVEKYPWVEGALYIELQKGQEQRVVTTLKRERIKIDIQKIKRLYIGEKGGESYLVDNTGDEKRLFLIKRESMGEGGSSFMIFVLDISSFEREMFSGIHSPLAVITYRGRSLFTRGISPRQLAQVNWKRLLEKGSRGRIRIGGYSYLWMMRYIGDLPLFYIVGG